MIKVKHKGGFELTERFLKRSKKAQFFKDLDKWGQIGVEALSAATPVRSGKTAQSWGYEIHHGDGVTQLIWTNSNTNRTIPIALLIQYGHATRNGSFIQGIDYINPALKPVFEEIANSVWKEVTKE